MMNEKERMADNFWWIVAVCSSCLSILGGIFILYTYRAIPVIQNSSRELLLYLTIADIGTAYGNLIGTVRFIALYYSTDYENLKSSDDFLCKAQSFLTTICSMSSFMWTSFIAINVFFLYVHNRIDLYRSSVAVRIVSHIGGWVIPGIIAVVALSLGKLGEDLTLGSTGWCWISGKLEQSDKIIWKFVTKKFVELMTYLTTATLYILLKFFTLRRRGRDPGFNWSSISNHLRKEDENFCYAWMILYLTRLWSTIRFFMEIYLDQNDFTKIDKVLTYFHAYGDSAQAFWNCILFCLFDKTVRDYVFARYRVGNAVHSARNIKRHYQNLDENNTHESNM